LHRGIAGRILKENLD